jgi:hypothetical protein
MIINKELAFYIRIANPMKEITIESKKTIIRSCHNR